MISAHRPYLSMRWKLYSELVDISGCCKTWMTTGHVLPFQNKMQSEYQFTEHPAAVIDQGTHSSRRFADPVQIYHSFTIGVIFQTRWECQASTAKAINKNKPCVAFIAFIAKTTFLT